MNKQRKVKWKSLLLISIFLGYLGIDSFILKKTKDGIKKIIALALSVLIILNFETVLEFITKITQYSLYYTKVGMTNLGAGQSLLTHVPRLAGLAVLTLLVIAALSCAIAIFILWVKDIVSIVKRDEVEGIKWVN